jgi:hypothetical protein
MKSLKFISVVLSALIALLFLPVSPAGAAVNTVCAGSLPTGWVKTNDFWDPTRCGNPSRITYNVWNIASYYDQPVGAIMTVCSNQLPVGWVTINTQWDPTSCGHPSRITQNMWTIQRLS